MSDNKFKQKKNQEPIENQGTAAWANIEKLRGAERVPIPSEFNVEEAKEYVDENEK